MHSYFDERWAPWRRWEGEIRQVDVVGWGRDTVNREWVGQAKQLSIGNKIVNTYFNIAL